MFRYQSFQAKQVSKAAGDVPPYPLTLADNGNLLLDFKTFTLYFFYLFFRNCLILISLRFRTWQLFSAENVKIVLSESWEKLIMHLFVFVFVFYLQLYLFLFVYLYFWPILSRPKCDYGEHQRRSDLHIWGLPPSSVCRNSYFRQQPEKNKEFFFREIQGTISGTLEKLWMIKYSSNLSSCFMCSWQ